MPLRTAAIEQTATARAAAEKTAEIAEKQVAVETERIEIGIAIAVQVHEAEDQLRQAKLRTASGETLAASR